MMIKPNPSCDDTFCIKRQEEFKNKIIEKPECIEKDLSEDKVIHEDNEWGQFFI